MHLILLYPVSHDIESLMRPFRYGMIAVLIADLYRSLTNQKQDLEKAIDGVVAGALSKLNSYK